MIMTEVSAGSLGVTSRTFPIPLGGGRTITDAADGLRFLAEPRPVGDKIKQAIERAAKAVRGHCKDFHYWRAFDVWYRKASAQPYEVDAIIEAIEAREARAIRDEIREVRARLYRLESILVTQDPEFHRETIDAVREQAAGLGGKLISR